MKVAALAESPLGRNSLLVLYKLYRYASCFRTVRHVRSGRRNLNLPRAGRELF